MIPTHPPRQFRADALRPPPELDMERVRRFLAESPPGKRVLEIGCGVGLHPIQFASANPALRVIALERTRAKFAKFAARAAHHPALTNLLPLNVDAIPFVVSAFPEPAPTLEKVFLLYPNPEPKNPAQRWVRMPFFGYLLDRVTVGGEILIASNIASYLHEVSSVAPQWNSGKVGIEVSDVRPIRLGPADARTHFEKKYLERGEACGEITVRRVR